MAAITSTTSGPRSVGSTWVGGIAPTTGDTAIIANGHNVTVDSAWTIGTGAGAAITADAGGTLTLDAYAVTCDGDVSLAGDVAQGAGSTFTLNGNYNIIYTGSSGTWTMNGTSGNRCTLQAASTFGFAIRSAATTTAVVLRGTYANIRRWGRSNAIDEHATTIYSNGVKSEIDLTNCLVTDYWRLRFAITYTPLSTSIFRFTRCDFRNPLYTDVMEYTTDTPHDANTRGFFDCTFVGTAANNNVGFTSGGTTFGNNFYVSNCVAEDVHFNNSGGMPLQIDVFARKNAYTGGVNDITVSRQNNGGARVFDCIIDGGNRLNPHMISVSGVDGTNLNTIEDNITFGYDADANGILYTDSAIIRRNISVGGSGPTTAVAGTTAIVIERCTHIHTTSDVSAGLGISETSVYGAGLVTFRSCLMYGTAAATDRGIRSLAASWTLAYTDYNCWYNVSPSGDVYNNVTVTGKTENVDLGFGLYDITASPTMSNVNATLATWDTSLGGAGTVANAFAEALKKNGFDSAGSAATFNSAYTKSNALAYFRAAFAPNNVTLQAAGFGGEDIGALAVINVPPIGAVNININSLDNRFGSIRRG